MLNLMFCLDFFFNDTATTEFYTYSHTLSLHTYLPTFLAARRLAGGLFVPILAVMLLLTTPTILIQFTPFRIDHHGWQIWMAAVALCGALDARCMRGGVTAGLALAAVGRASCRERVCQYV